MCRGTGIACECRPVHASSTRMTTVLGHPSLSRSALQALLQPGISSCSKGMAISSAIAIALRAVERSCAHLCTIAIFGVLALCRSERVDGGCSKSFALRLGLSHALCACLPGLGRSICSDCVRQLPRLSNAAEFGGHVCAARSVMQSVLVL